MAFFRMLYCIMHGNIHDSLVINVDQTGIILIPGGDQRTYEQQGAKQVPHWGKEEKRAFTVVLSTAINGVVLPSQSIWKGSTDKSLPNIAARTNPEENGHRFVVNPNKYWSLFETTKLWFQQILEPYRIRMIKAHNLPLDPKVIVYHDCWAVHRGIELRSWLKYMYNWLIILFVPANCTGLFQPCDIVLQRVFKHVIRQEASNFFVKEVQKQLEHDILPAHVKICTDLGPLRNESAS